MSRIAESEATRMEVPPEHAVLQRIAELTKAFEDVRAATGVLLSCFCSSTADSILAIGQPADRNHRQRVTAEAHMAELTKAFEDGRAAASAASVPRHIPVDSSLLLPLLPHGAEIWVTLSPADAVASAAVYAVHPVAHKTLHHTEPRSCQAPMRHSHWVCAAPHIYMSYVPPTWI